MTDEAGTRRPLALSAFAHVLESKADCHRALRDGTLSSNPGGYWSTTANLLMMDDPRHAPVRSEVRKIIARLDPLPGAVREEIAAVVDALRDRSKIDLVNDFAKRVSSVVVQALLGLREPLTDELLDTISRTAANLDIWTTGSTPENLSMFEAVRFFLRAGSAESGGLALLRDAAEHQRVTEEELLVMPVVLAHAAYENSMNLLAVGGLRLATDQEQRRRMAESSDGMGEVGRMVNEVCPTRYVIRRATADTRIRAHLVQAGEKVAIPLDGPVELPFGSGRHACPGTRLALAEAAFSLHRFARVVSGEWAPVEVEWKTHPIFHGLRNAVVARRRRSGS
jgi:cytochrome P450